MRKCILFFIFVFFLFSCNVTIKEKMEIGFSDVRITIEDDLIEEGKIYHLYFKNILDNDKSFGINILDSSEYVGVKLFPGEYEIYSYGLIDKTSSSKKVSTYCILKNIRIHSGTKHNVLLDLKELIPYIKIINDGDMVINVYMESIYDIFSLSSISLKQGSDRVRSLDYEFYKEEKYYKSKIIFYEHGPWFLNVSYSLKSKKDNKILEKDNIYISTSYFKNIELGEY